MDAARHLRDKARLDQALNGELEEASNEIGLILRKHNIDSAPEIAFDVCRYTIEKMYLARLRCPEY